jgi:carboxypeptidase C (cathepsin A)
MKLKDDVFYSGYFPVDNDNGQDMFYMLFESRSDRKKDPLVIWIRGEQGCSASADLFSEMGPYQFKVNETTGGIPTLVPNVHAWNNFTNLMILDAQIGTGYSFIRGAKPKTIWTMDNAVLYFVRFMK